MCGFSAEAPEVLGAAALEARTSQRARIPKARSVASGAGRSVSTSDQDGAPCLFGFRELVFGRGSGILNLDADERGQK